MTANEIIKDLKNRRQLALYAADRDYNTPTSKHYKDNERYSWAVKTINERYDELELKQTAPLLRDDNFSGHDDADRPFGVHP